MAVWRYISTHSYPRDLMGRSNLFTRRSMCTRGKNRRYPLHRSRSIYIWPLQTFVHFADWDTALYYTTFADAHVSARGADCNYTVSQSAPACLQLNHVHTLSLQFKLFSSHVNCLICNCVPAVKSDEEERLPGVSWRRAFNSSFDVWPLLLLSTSETPESAGLGGREPGTREYI